MVHSPRINPLDVSSLTKKIQASQSLILTTHKQCDGDGLGAQLALFHALKKSGKDVRVMCVDAVPRKYKFLEPDKFVEIFEGPHQPVKETDLCLVFDTNDRRLVEPLYSELEAKTKEILFVDHHPILNQGPEPTPGSFIETRAASTGEIAYFIIKSLGIRFDEQIARALYTSIAFDTQIFRYVRGSATSHLICAELLSFLKDPEEVHRNLFATFSKGKVDLLAKVFSEVEYHCNDRVAVIVLSNDDLEKNNLEMDDSRDIIDMIMNINSVRIAALFRQENGGYKMSLRSKGRTEVLGIAESFGGGGHLHAAGAYISADFATAKQQVVDQLMQRLDKEIKSQS